MLIGLSRLVFLAVTLPVLTLATMPNAFAKELLLIAPMTGFSLLASTNPEPFAGPVPYSQTAGTPDWSVVAWSDPDGRLPPFSSKPNGATQIYSTRGKAAGISVTFDASVVTLTLDQEGDTLACNRPNGSPLEFDLFAQPNDRDTRLPLRSGYLPFSAQGLALAGLKQLIFSTDIEMQQGLAITRKNCSANFGGLVAAVILTDRAIKPTETLFYQLFLSRFCGINPAVKLSACGQPIDINQFFINNPYGFDDYAPLAGVQWAAQGRWLHINTDLLPRILRCLNVGRGGIDPISAHWSISSIYIGQNIYGDIRLSSSWRNVQLVANKP